MVTIAKKPMTISPLAGKPAPKEMLVDRVASAIVCDGVVTVAVVFAPEYGNQDDHQIGSHLCSRDCAGSTGPDRLAPEA
jgi:hypothetical protein